MNARKVIVTGGFGTLGLAVARAFAAERATVALVGRGAVAADVQREFAPPHRILGEVDLASQGATVAAVSDIVATFHGVDVLVNVAGGFRWQTVRDGSLDGWDAMYTANLRTAVTATRAALPYLLESSTGRVVNVGAGVAARTTGSGMGAYAASKAGVHKFTESLADELKDVGITVNAVLPGTIDTPQNRASMPDADVSRWVTPAEIADVILFLASERARAVTGALIPVSGRG